MSKITRQTIIAAAAPRRLPPLSRPKPAIRPESRCGMAARLNMGR